MSLRRAAITALLLATAACVPRAPAPTPAPPVERPPTMVVPLPTQPKYENWADAPQTPGDWTYSSGPQTTAATFGVPGKEPKFRLSCSRTSRQITLTRVGITAAEGDSMIVHTEAVDRTLPTATPDRRVLETLAYLPASDPLLDAIAFSKGRFAIELGLFSIYLPSWPEVTRVIEDCR